MNLSSERAKQRWPASTALLQRQTALRGPQLVHTAHSDKLSAQHRLTAHSDKRSNGRAGRRTLHVRRGRPGQLHPETGPVRRRHRVHGIGRLRPRHRVLPRQVAVRLARQLRAVAKQSRAPKTKAKSRGAAAAAGPQRDRGLTPCNRAPSRRSPPVSLQWIRCSGARPACKCGRA